MNPLLEVNELRVRFRDDYGERIVTDDISFEVMPSEFLGIVGESGCGKSVTNLAVMGLLPNSAAITHGSIHFEGKDLLALSDSKLDAIRGKDLCMVYQDALTSLDPVFTIGSQLRETIAAHLTKDRKQAKELALAVLKDVGLEDGERILSMYPHELSGGMRQRVMIAMALVCHPRLLIADEPTTALDVTIQAEIMGMLGRIQKETSMAMVLITHDIGLIAQTADRVLVMYAGQIVEEADVHELFHHPSHPYTRMLLASVPEISTRKDRRLVNIQGTVPQDYTHIEGCRYASRCPFASAQCAQKQEMVAVEKGHLARCYRAKEFYSHDGD